jgi:queuine tRNA-ribosyltransferase
VYDGRLVHLSPEEAVTVQEQLGADIQMVLDVCTRLPAGRDALRVAVTRTAAWAQLARKAKSRPDQALFGIVQGGTHGGLRMESARRTVELDFDGYGIGGLSVGESRVAMLDALGITVAELPAGRLRYLMGVGDPVGMLEAIACGVDLFDCVAPTRGARHGTAWTTSGRLSLRAAANATDDRPIDEQCSCHTCRRWSRGYLRHLLTVGEPSVLRLVTMHNLAYMFDLVRRARRAITDGTFVALRSETAAAWGA